MQRFVFSVENRINRLNIYFDLNCIYSSIFFPYYFGGSFFLSLLNIETGVFCTRTHMFYVARTGRVPISVRNEVDPITRYIRSLRLKSMSVSVVIVAYILFTFTMHIFDRVTGRARKHIFFCVLVIVVFAI